MKKQFMHYLSVFFLFSTNLMLIRQKFGVLFLGAVKIMKMNAALE